jgi:transglutaminase-like putative cysteine protease
MLKFPSSLTQNLGFRQLSPQFSRESSDNFLLLLALLLTLASHYPYLNWSISLTSLGFLIWRGYLALMGRALPRRWILNAISLAAIALVVFTYKAFLGREPGVALLVLLVSAKTLEMHLRRDSNVVLFLAYFCLLISFFHSQTLSSTLLVTLALFFLLTTHLSFQYERLYPPLWTRMKAALKLMGLALPMMLICFVFFPRIQGPLWGNGDPNANAKSGLSDTLSPGNISKLALSEDIALRVKLSQKAPEQSQLYWRAYVLNQFDGKSWTRSTIQSSPLVDSRTPQLDQLTQNIDQEIILEPKENTILISLDFPNKAPHIPELEPDLNQHGEILIKHASNQRLRYQISSNLSYRLDAELDHIDRQVHLNLPRRGNPRTHQLAYTIAQHYPSSEQRVQAVLRYFREQEFFYTLEPPLLSGNSIDEFLFNTRQGFCEHYSSSFVFLMRSMGIPARIVTGYQGGSLNPFDGFVEIRQSDAHAWAEVWIQDKGWQRVDPTAAVAPNRISLNLASTQPRSALAQFTQIAFPQNEWTQYLRQRWSALNNNWNQWVLNFNQEKQFNLFRGLGLENPDWRSIAIIFILCATLCLAIIAIPLLRPQVPHLGALDRLYFDLIEKLKRLGHPVATHMGPNALLEQVVDQLSPEKQEVLRAFIRHYVTLQYAGQVIEANHLSQLKQLLKRL